MVHAMELQKRKQRLGLSGSHQAAEESKHPKPMWRELLAKVKNPERDAQERRLWSEIEATQRKFEALQLTRRQSPLFSPEPKPQKEIKGAFDPLSAEAEKRVEDALTSTDRHKVLVMHENSNIDISGSIIRCLLPGAWLNDEVINLYMELLKEREVREPERFLRCHFFNTFFYNKLYKDKQRYDYKAVRRWTTQRKIGYLLSECDKILVPVHQDIHWCLAVINVRDRKVEYLDSLKGSDANVLKVLSQYFVDEVKDKCGQDMDVSDWEMLYPRDIPEQMNGCDCGMFMLKYADFHSRGAPLSFTQKDMDYFRKKTVWEILQLTAT